MGPRFSGKVREEPQRRERKWGRLQNQDFRDSPNQDQTSWLVEREAGAFNPQRSGRSSPNISRRIAPLRIREICLNFQYSSP